MKRILIISAWALVAVLIVLSLVFVNYKIKNTSCKSVSVIIDYHNSDPLVTNGDILSQITKGNDSLVGQPMKKIDLISINDSIISNPYIKDADIQTSFEGDIIIRLSQRRPILRVCNSEGKSYYISEDGKLLNVRSLYPVRVMVANGDIFTPYNEALKLDINEQNDKDSATRSLVVYQLYKLGMYIDKDEWLKLFIDQVFVMNKEFVLVPKIGNYSIFFGSIDNMEEKFRNLKAFIERGIDKVGWDKYKTLNLKYKNQIVCTKIKNE